MFNTLAPLALLTAVVAGGSPLDRARLELLLHHDESEIIAAAFVRHSEHVLPFIDHYLEGALKRIERGGFVEDDVLPMFIKGVRFARIADKCFNTHLFGAYAKSFASWNDEERRKFRQGRQAYRAGRAEANPEKALAHYQEALKLAQPLGDSWGEAMAYAGIARMNESLGHKAEAFQEAQKANTINYALRLRKDRIQVSMIMVRTIEAAVRDYHSESSNGSVGQETVTAKVVDTQTYYYAREAWEHLHLDDPPELQSAVFELYHDILVRRKATEAAEKVRKQYEAMTKGQPTEDESAATTRPSDADPKEDAPK